MRILVFGNSYQADHLPKVRECVRRLALAGGCLVEVWGSFRDILCEGDPLLHDLTLRHDPDEIITADLALSFGGDGTFLHAADLLAPHSVPLLGVNTGHLGFLAALTLDEAIELMPGIVAGDYVVERRAMLSVESDAAGTLPPALNEVALLKGDTASMVEVETSLDSQPLALYKGDGLIISTPTGSTAYNLSVGGPVLAPGCGAFVISPVAPHTLTMRPLVVPSTSVITAVPRSRVGSVCLSVDGNSVTIPSGSSLSIRLSECLALIARPVNKTYFDTLRSKLLWGK